MKIKKAVITAAARGSRIYPVADTVQKAMLPIIDKDGIHKPIIQIIAEEAFNSGIEEICIVCAPGDDERYISNFNTLRNAIHYSPMNEEEKRKQSASIKNFLDRVNFAVQREALGYGDAVYKAKSFVGNDSFLLLTGDYLYNSYIDNTPCAKQLIDLAESENCPVSAVNQTHEHLITKYGTLTGKSLIKRQGAFQIEKIIEKPSVTQAELELQTPGLKTGNYLCFFGMSVFVPYLFDLLEDYIAHNSVKVILLTPVLQKLAETEQYLALEIQGNRYDTSKKLGLIQAQLALALAGSIKEELLSIIVETMGERLSR